MIKLALLGANISHSRSQEIYESLLGQKVDYSLIDIPSPQDVPPLSRLFETYELKGLSITYPYKKHYLKNVMVEDNLIKGLNAINCIQLRDNTFFGTNTDYLAALELMSKKYLEKYKSFIILGSGNMAKVFEAVFLRLGLDVKILSRSKDGNLNNLDYSSIIEDEHTLIINTCSREYEFWPKTNLVCGFWDMNYSFQPHQNLEQKGLVYHEGIDLLREQAKFALRFWEMGHLIKNL